MPKKLFHGSCHCGKIKYQVNIDLTQETIKCNCTFCRKNSNWNTKVKDEDFEILEGQDYFSKYSSDPNIGEYIFCKYCGNMPFGITKKTEWTEEGASIKLSSLDDISVAELAALKITYYNGKDDSFSIITDPEEIKTMY
jgi:hypothetical protein